MTSNYALKILTQLLDCGVTELQVLERIDNSPLLNDVYADEREEIGQNKSLLMHILKTELNEDVQNFKHLSASVYNTVRVTILQEVGDKADLGEYDKKLTHKQAELIKEAIRNINDEEDFKMSTKRNGTGGFYTKVLYENISWSATLEDNVQSVFSSLVENPDRYVGDYCVYCHTSLENDDEPAHYLEDDEVLLCEECYMQYLAKQQGLI